MFQYMMDKLLERHRTFSNAYIDDVIMFSRTWEEHIHHLNVIFERIQRARLITEKKKCYFGAQHVKYLVHIVGGREVKMENSKLEAVFKFPTLKTKKDVKSVSWDNWVLSQFY